MNPKYKFYLDGTLLVTEPRGWDDIHFMIKQDKDLNGQLIFIDVELEFFDDGYEHIRDKLYGEGFCTSVALKILENCADGNYRVAHEGLIKLSKVTIDEKLCSAKVKPDDNSFYAKIDKNRSLKAFPWVSLSKNGVTITPATLEKIGFFNPTDGVYYSILNGVGEEYSCSGYRVYEIFRYLIAFMSDDTIEFDSTLFGTGGDFEFLMLTTGTVMFTVQTGLGQASFEETFPDISFKDFYSEIYKKLNIGFYFDYSGLKPKMIIERSQDIPTGVDIVTLDNIKGVTTKVDTQRLYSVLKIGSSITQDVISLQFPEGIDWLGFKEEEYNILGDCGVDSTLDLVSNYIISSNVIEDAVVNQSDQYEGEFALISCRAYHAGVHLAKQDNWLSPPPPPYYYNFDLTNAEVAKRFLGAVPASIAKYLNVVDTDFLAEMTTNGLLVNVNHEETECRDVGFDDDFTPPNFDEGNNYDPVTNAFTCPQNGAYNFTARLNVTIFPNNPTGQAVVRNYVNFQRYDSSFVLMQEITSNVYTNTFNTNTNFVFTFSSVLFLNAGDKVKVSFCQHTVSNLSATGSHYATFWITNGSTFACDSSATGGGIYQTYDPKDYLGLTHEFEYFINESQWNAIRTNPRGNIVFAQKGQTLRKARIDKLDFNKTGVSQVTLLRSINT